MAASRRTRWAGYAVAAVGVAAAIGVRLLLDPLLGGQFPVATLFVAVLAAAGYAGFGPGLAATLLGAAAAAWFVMPPRHSFAIDGVIQQTGLALYVVVGAGIAALGGALRAARERAEAAAAAAARQREELRTTLASIGDAVLVTDADGRVVSLNPAAERLTGWASTDAAGVGVAAVVTLVDGPTRRPVDDPAAWVLRDHPPLDPADDLVLRARGGAERPVEITAARIKGAGGRFAGGVLVFRDVTARRAAEQPVRDQAHVLTGILAATVDHVYVVGRDGRYRYVSAGGARVLGFEPHQIVGRDWRELGLPADVMERFDAQRERALRTGAPGVEEALFPLPGGGELCFEYVVTPIAGPGEAADAVVVVSRDVTERKRAERELKLHSRVLESMSEGVSLADEGGVIRYTNATEDRMFGYGPGELVGRHVTVQNDYPPEENARVVAGVIERLKADGVWAGEWRNRRKDGTPFTTFARITALEADGRRYWVCVQEDVTAKRAAEAALREVKALLDAIVAHTPACIFAKDRDGRYLLANPALAALVGVPPDEFAGRTDADYFPPEAAAEFRRDDAAVIASGRPRTYEETFTRDGVTRTYLTVKFPLRDAAGEAYAACAVATEITDLKRVEAAVRESEERLRLALEAGRMGVWDWDVRTNEIRWSDNLEPVHGLARGAFGGTLEAFQRLVHPDDRDAVAAAIARALDERGAYDVEFRNLWADGSVHWMAGKGKVFAGADGRPARMVGVGMDVTARKRAEQDARFLADASATLAALTDYASTLGMVARLAVPHFADWAAVDMLDDDGTLRRLAVAHVDPARVALAHDVHRRFPPDPAAPQGVWQIVRTGKPELVPDITDDLLVATVPDPELLAVLRELGLRSYVGVPLVARGRVLGTVTFIAAESGRRYDAADLRLAEDLAHRAAVAIDNARLYQQVREADRRKDEFLAVLGHELRNPLAPISNALHVLKLAGAGNPVAERAREMMERQVKHVVRLVDDLLDVSRIVRGKVRLAREPVDVAAVVARAVETVQPLVDAEGHALALALPDDPVRVSGDPVRLAQVVGNLLTNAARYTDRGGRIAVEVGRAGDRAVVRVKDTGIGIAAEALPGIWELFVQAERRTRASQGGMGIGLALVKGLVELHGGTVAAASDGPGKGSVFTVTLPLLAETGAAAGDEPPESAPPRSAPRRVLVVDDNVDAAESFALLLRLGGHDVRVAHDGPAALALADADPPEVAFLDIGMPGMDGYELARRLRERPALRDVVLVALTGWGQEKDRLRTKEAGFDAHEVKPVGVDAVERLLSTPRRG